MVNYQNGKIYKIVSGDLTYIGSTCEPTLARRMATHKGDYRVYLNGKRDYVTSFKLLENGNAEIFLLELFPCNSKDELHARERYHIENNECVNKVIPNRTRKEYYEANKDKIKEEKKLYYEVNKDKIKEYKEQYNKANKDKINEQMKLRYEANKDKILEQKKLYYQKIKLNKQLEIQLIKELIKND